MGVEIAKAPRRGLRHSSNPFLSSVEANASHGSRRISSSTGSEMMMVNGFTGEIVSSSVGFWQTQEVDRTQFVKLYVNGVKAFKALSGAGTKVFELLYFRVQESIGKDQLWITFPNIDQALTPLGETTFYRGMKELILKSFIAESLTPGLYYLNPDYMWNGDRLAFVKEYRKKGAPSSDMLQREKLEAAGQMRIDGAD